MAPSTAKGKEKVLGEPKRSTRLTRQTSAALDLENTAMDSATYDDAVDYGYSDAPDPVTTDAGIRIAIVPASSSLVADDDASRPTTGSTLDLPDEEYLSPDTEDAMAAIALAGNDTDGEEAYDMINEPTILADGITTGPEPGDFAIEAGGNPDAPATPAAHTGRRNTRTPAGSERPHKRTRERTQQSPWAATGVSGEHTTSVFPLNRAQVVAERAASSVHATQTAALESLAGPNTNHANTHTRTSESLAGPNTNHANTHTCTSGSLADVLLPHALAGAPAAPLVAGASFTLTQEQLLTIIAAAQNGSLANLVNNPSSSGTGVPGSLIHEQGTSAGHAVPPVHATRGPQGIRRLASVSNDPRRMFLGRQTAAPAAPPSAAYLDVVTHGLGTPFDAGPVAEPTANSSGFTPLVRCLANPSTAALHALPPAQSVILSADDRITPHKVQKILRSGFREHIPLHHLTNKLMEEAAFSTPSSSTGIQISGQTISLGSVGLDKTGERNLTPETWIECSMNLVRSMAEHLLAGTDGRCGGPTARIIASRFE
ncbi:hypothetical protein H0H92_004165 [Tricholoma furcatifolium]|nr:hypothetical protein H0H92_004165 [Tricholoma furcatifolium]